MTNFSIQLMFRHLPHVLSILKLHMLKLHSVLFPKSVHKTALHQLMSAKLLFEKWVKCDIAAPGAIEGSLSAV